MKNLFNNQELRKLVIIYSRDFYIWLKADTTGQSLFAVEGLKKEVCEKLVFTVSEHWPPSIFPRA